MVQKVLYCILLFSLLACTRETSLYYRIDARYLRTVPQYQNGRTYVGDNNDTLTLLLTSDDVSWIVAGQNPQNGKQVVLERKYTYYQVNGNGIPISFQLKTIPDLYNNKLDFTEFRASLPAGGFELDFIENDTLFNPTIQYAKEMIIGDVRYKEVYYNTNSFYYSLYGELISFKILSTIDTTWYTILPE